MLQNNPQRSSKKTLQAKGTSGSLGTLSLSRAAELLSCWRGKDPFVKFQLHCPPLRRAGTWLRKLNGATTCISAMTLQEAEHPKGSVHSGTDALLQDDSRVNYLISPRHHFTSSVCWHEARVTCLVQACDFSNRACH